MLNIRDSYGRTFRSLRVSLTNKCNFGCIYCVNNDKTINAVLPAIPLNYDELAFLIIRLNNDLRFDGVRLTGGEPLLYLDLIPFINLLTAGGVENIKLTTNGFLLKSKAEGIAAAGIKGINVSLDSVDPDVFGLITGRDTLLQVLDGIDSALNSGISVKLNAVIMKGINDNQIPALLEYAQSRNIKLRFLELMRMGHLYSREFRKYFFSMYEILETVKSRYKVVSSYREKSATAKYWVIENNSSVKQNEFEFGIISNESEPFCFDCNRLRLDSYGKVYGCLSENKHEDISGIIENKKLLKEKLQRTLLHKQSLKFKGSNLKMIEIGG